MLSLYSIVVFRQWTGLSRPFKQKGLTEEDWQQFSLTTFYFLIILNKGSYQLGHQAPAADPIETEITVN